jgi:hypothetical protein
MPSLKNCEKCGKVFTAQAVEILCAECTISEAKDLKKVTDFLRDNPLASIMEVNQKTGVKQQQLFRFIKSGSLKMRRPAEDFKCRLCGKDIKKGTLCDACRSKVEGMQKKAGNEGTRNKCL